MMFSEKLAISVCMFGSAARLAGDELSDRDVLVVYRDYGEARPEIEKLKRSGWSVATYSRSRFDAMSSRGNLFVQHIKQEGRILEDEGNWLRDRLLRFQPNDSYEAQARESLELLKPIERLIFKGNYSLLICDIFYVFVRHYVINRFATQGRYIFAYDSLIEEYVSHEKLPAPVGDVLHKLRKWKHAYRGGEGDRPSEEECRWLSVALGEIAGFDRTGVVEGDAPIRVLGTGYATLRECEAYLMRNSLKVSSEETPSRLLEEVWRIIRDPRGYSWNVRNLNAITVSELNSVLQETTADAAA